MHRFKDAKWNLLYLSKGYNHYYFCGFGDRCYVSGYDCFFFGVGSCWVACMVLVIAIFLHVIWEIDDIYLVVTVASSLQEGVEIYPYGFFLFLLLDELCI